MISVLGKTFLFMNSTFDGEKKTCAEENGAWGVETLLLFSLGHTSVNITNGHHQKHIAL